MYDSAHLKHLLQKLEIKNLPLKNPGTLGTYLESYIHLVKLEDVLEVVKNWLLDPQLRGLTQLPELVWQEGERYIKNLPVKTIRINPLQFFNADATLFVETDYVELNDVLEVIDKLHPSLALMAKVIVTCASQLIQFKIETGFLFVGEGAEITDLAAIVGPELEGKGTEVQRGEEIRAKAIAYLHQSDAISQLSRAAKFYIFQAITDLTSAAWWLKNEHRAAIAILLQANNILDAAILEHSAPVL
ncbi:MAG: hypothetical protein Fur0025_26010 [Oscillatoriaceae cyanobacterium]